MRIYLLIIGALLGCSKISPTETRDFEGIFNVGDDTHDFAECKAKGECSIATATAEPCWVKEAANVEKAIEGAKRLATNELEPATFRVKFYGSRSFPVGGAGHMGMSKCEIVVSKFEYIKRIDDSI